AVFSQTKALMAELDYTPYGQAYTAHDTIGITHRYTGHDWDATAALYFAPYRFSNPHPARCMPPAPLGTADGPNVYSYVSNSPTSLVDRLGASGWPPMPIPRPGPSDPSPTDCAIAYTACVALAVGAYAATMRAIDASAIVSYVICEILHHTGTV